MWKYYAVRIALVIWTLCLLASAALQLNTQIPYTYHFGAIHGILYSERYVSRQSIALALSSTRMFQLLCICGLMTFRKISCGPYPGATVFWTLLLASLVLFDLIALIINSSYLSMCNSPEPGNQGNPCNAPNWCCAPEVFSNSANGCRNASPCIPGYAVTSVSQLGKRADFLWVFSLNVLFVAAGIVFVILASRILARQLGILKRTVNDEIISKGEKELAYKKE
jgi:hypothetical protein